MPRDGNPMRAIALTLLLTTAGLAQAAMYKWVDEDGNVHYGQRPPAGRPYERMRPAPRPSTPPEQADTRLEQLRRQIEEAGRAREEADRKAAAQQAEAARRRQNCAIARRNLANLEMGGRKKLVGPDGVAYFPTPEEIEAKKAAARKAIEENCE